MIQPGIPAQALIGTGALAGIVGVPIVVAAGGLVASAFALGPALINRRLRGLDTLLREAETAPVPDRPSQRPTPATTTE